MTLPGITLPPGTPMTLATGHGIDSDVQFADAITAVGAARRRRVRTDAARVVSVGWLLDAAQLAAVEDWFENTLQAGTREFAVEVKNQVGEGMAWWTARWVSFQVEMLHRGRGRLTGQLLLTGEPSDTAPDTGALEAELYASLDCVPASPVVPVALELELSAALVAPVVLAVEFVAALEADLSAYPPDGSDRERILVRLAGVPVPGNEIDRSVQERLQQAWMGI